MSVKIIKNNRLTIFWYSLLFILIFLPLVIANQQANDHRKNEIKLEQINKQDKQTELIHKNMEAEQENIKLRKQRFIKKELTHQNHHFHNKYYSSLPIVSSNYRSSVADSSIYLNEEQSDAYVPYRSLHNHSLLTGNLGSSSILQSISRNKLSITSHLVSSIQGPVFQLDLPAKISFSNNSGLILNCAASGSPQPIITWQTETGISVLSPSKSIDSLNMLNSPLVHQNSVTNALVFRAFAPDEFSPEVHQNKFRCVATNIHGTITSPLVQVKAGMSFNQFKKN